MTNVEEMVKTIARYAIQKNLKLATAESCTGGNIGNKITNVPGASKYYLGGVIAYDNSVKVKLLGVKKETLEKHGAVSEQCAREMAEGVARLMNSDIAIATTGIAGPSGGSKDKPVGTVFIAYHIPGKTIVERKKFDGTREEIKEKIVRYSLLSLSEILQKSRLYPGTL